MSCLLTRNIRFCDYSTGGIKQIYLTNKDFINSIALDENGQIIAFNPSASIYWLVFDTNRASTSITENLEQGDNKNIYKQDLDTTFIEMDASKRATLEQIVKGELVALVKDENGKYWSLGEDNGLEVKGYSATSETVGGVNRYTLKLTTYSCDPMRAVDFDSLPEFWVPIEDCSIYAGQPLSAIPPPLAPIFDCLIDFSN